MSWQVLTPYRHVLTLDMFWHIFDSFWHFFDRQTDRWTEGQTSLSYMTCFDTFWHVLTLFWQFLTFFDIFLTDQPTEPSFRSSVSRSLKIQTHLFDSIILALMSSSSSAFVNQFVCLNVHLFVRQLFKRFLRPTVSNLTKQ